MYCWHAFINDTAPGLYFASINYSVHSISEYCLLAHVSIASLRTRHFAAITRADQARALSCLSTLNPACAALPSAVYFYYFLSITGGPLRALARPIAPLITTVQLLQMVAGAAITFTAALRHNSDPTSCSIDPVNYRVGCAMYLSYLVLFACLFYDHYLRPGGKHAKARQGGQNNPKVCGVDLKGQDDAGFFHGKSELESEKRAPQKDGKSKEN